MLKSMMDSIVALTSTQHDDDEGDERVKDGRMFGESTERQWRLLADFAIPYMAYLAEKPNGKDE